MPENFAEIKAAIRLSRLPGVGAARFFQLLNEHSSPAKALAVLLDSKAVPNQAQSLTKAATIKEIDHTLALLKNREIFGFYCTGPDYPVQLLDLGEPPPVLFSTTAKLPSRFAAVVGSRHPDAQAIAAVPAIVEKLARAGFAILSGGATGIDSLAHQAALEVNAPTFSVFACGLDVVYPAENSRLFARIRQSGGLISELLCTARPHKSFFPTRNRIIAGLAEVVVVIQAAGRSGSLTTAGWARRLKRRLLIKSAPTSGDANWQGGEALIARGAEPFALDFSL